MSTMITICIHIYVPIYMHTRIYIHIILYMYVHVFKSQQKGKELKQNYHFYVCIVINKASKTCEIL